MDCDDVGPVTEPLPSFSPVEMFRESLDENGILHEAALFTAKLRSNPKIPLGVVNDIVQRCTDFLTPAVRAVKHEVQSILHDNSIPESKSSCLLRMLVSLIESLRFIYSTYSYLPVLGTRFES